MAKTIEEIANEYADGITMPEDAAMCKAAAYYGANAVLEEIEKCLDNPSMIQGYSDILAKVQELKGE